MLTDDEAFDFSLKADPDRKMKMLRVDMAPPCSIISGYASYIKEFLPPENSSNLSQDFRIWAEAILQKLDRFNEILYSPWHSSSLDELSANIASVKTYAATMKNAISSENDLPEDLLLCIAGIGRTTNTLHNMIRDIAAEKP